MSGYLVHSAKGSEWKKHKYLKKIGDRYYYADRDTFKNIEGNQSSAKKLETSAEYNRDMAKIYRNELEKDREARERLREYLDYDTVNDIAKESNRKWDHIDRHEADAERKEKGSKIASSIDDKYLVKNVAADTITKGANIVKNILSGSSKKETTDVKKKK